MCILFIAYKQIEQYPLIVAANRDEFYDRPTRPSRFWPDQPDLLAGKDLKAGGTWMGINRTGKIAALTNIREPDLLNQNAVSRGRLTVDFLTTDISVTQYLQHLRATAHQYNGFNLLFGTVDELYVYNNRSNTSIKLTSGIHGLSNAALNSPWPKLTRGMKSLKNHCTSAAHVDIEKLFTLLRNDEQAADHELPATGVPVQWEKQLSAIFIRTPNYGTRTSTVLTISHRQEVTWSERSYCPKGEIINQEAQKFTLA